MKQFIIETDGTINNKATPGTPEKLYGTYDNVNFRVHFSETEPTKTAQINALCSIFNNATCGKIPQRTKQYAKNVVGFYLWDEPIAANADPARQGAFDELKAEAIKFNAAIKGGQQPPQGGGQPPQGGGQPPQGGGQQKPVIDKTKDVFGRPLEQAYPGLFQPNMTPQEKKKACDEYWAMIEHVDRDIFHKT